MLCSYRDVLNSVCVHHGHAFSWVQDSTDRVDEHVLAVAYEGCSCRRQFRGLRSYSPTNQDPVNQFYETDDLDSVLEAVKAVHTVATEISEAVRDDETVVYTNIDLMINTAAKDAKIAAAYAVISDYDKVTVEEIERTAAAVMVLLRNTAAIQNARAISRANATAEARASGADRLCRLCNNGICWNKTSYGLHTVCDQCVQRLIREAN
jgi:hypothetical protein